MELSQHSLNTSTHLNQSIYHPLIINKKGILIRPPFNSYKFRWLFPELNLPSFHKGYGEEDLYHQPWAAGTMDTFSVLDGLEPWKSWQSDKVKPMFYGIVGIYVYKYMFTYIEKYVYIYIYVHTQKHNRLQTT